jgi:enoyl-CoA hydratase
MSVVEYAVTDRVARITLNRPERGNGINRALITELEVCVERADLDPAVHVILLAGNGKGFCGGYDLVESAEGHAASPSDDAVPGSPLDLAVIRANHEPGGAWDPMVDHAMMSRNVRGFMSLFQCGKPVVCRVHGFCVAGGTDMALCSDLLVIAADATIGYPPARVWGSPTTAMWVYRIGMERAKRLLLTGDSVSGRQAEAIGLISKAVPAAQLDADVDGLAHRMALLPQNQLAMMKLLVNQAYENMGLSSTQTLGTLLDGIARHTPEGVAWRTDARERGVKAALLVRDGPFGDYGARPKGS